LLWRPLRSRGPLEAPTSIALRLSIALLTAASTAAAAGDLEGLREKAAARLGVEPSAVVIPHEVPDEAVERARGWVGGGTPKQRLERLLESLGDPARFNLAYRASITYTAAEVLANGQGNCLGLSSLLVGLARGLGFDASYIDASERHTDVYRVRDFSVSEGHIGVLVRLKNASTAVDFDGQFGKFEKYRVMDDLEALAHYHNNLAYQEIYRASGEGRAIDWGFVRSEFDRATKLAPQMAASWNNLGVAESNLGDRAEAERYYTEAIARNKRLGSPYSNLGKLYLEAGDLESAIRTFTKATKVDRDNPQHHYNRGYALYRAGQIDAAIDALETSVRLGGGPEAQALLDETRRAHDARRATRS
jgi:tetratricopeptide (TPR) repeat protein